MSIVMTLSDFERRDLRGYPKIRSYIDQMTKFGMVTQVGSSVFRESSALSNRRERSEAPSRTD